MEADVSLSILTWAVLLGPMPLAILLAAVGYFRARRGRGRSRR